MINRSIIGPFILIYILINYIESYALNLITSYEKKSRRWLIWDFCLTTLKKIEHLKKVVYKLISLQLMEKLCIKICRNPKIINTSVRTLLNFATH